MAVTWGGWAPAPEPAPEQRMMMSLIPHIAENILRPQTQPGMQDLAMQQARIDAIRAGMQQEAARNAVLNLLTRAQTRQFGAETETMEAERPGRVAQQGATLGQTRAGTLLTKETTAGKKSVREELTETRPERDELAGLGLLKIKADIGKIEVGKPLEKIKAESATFDLQGSMDFRGWDGTSPPTPAGRAYADTLKKMLRQELTNTASTLQKAMARSGDMLGGGGGVDPNVIAQLTAEMKDIVSEIQAVNKYLGIARQPTSTGGSKNSPEDIKAAAKAVGVKYNPQLFGE